MHLLYQMAMLWLFKSVDNCFYVFDSHVRNCFVMPDVKGSAVVMKYDITQLELQLSSLSLKLNSEIFYQLSLTPLLMTHSVLCHQTKIHIKEKGLKKQKAKEKKGLKKLEIIGKNISEETETEIQIRIEKMKAYCAVKKLTQTEFERKAHLEK